MSEIEQSQSLSEWEALKRMVPSWQNARVEPLLPPADSGVGQPVWNKVDFGENTTSSSSAAAAISPGSVTVIITKQVGDTMIPVLMIPVEGTVFTEL